MGIGIGIGTESAGQLFVMEASESQRRIAGRGLSGAVVIGTATETCPRSKSVTNGYRTELWLRLGAGEESG